MNEKKTILPSRIAFVGSDDFRSVVDSVTHLLVRLTSLSDINDEMGLGRIKLDGQTKARRAVKLLTEYCDNIEVAQLRAKRIHSKDLYTVFGRELEQQTACDEYR